LELKGGKVAQASLLTSLGSLGWSGQALQVDGNPSVFAIVPQDVQNTSTDPEVLWQVNVCGPKDKALKG